MVGISLSKSIIGVALGETGNTREARELIEEAAHINRRLNNNGAYANNLMELGNLYLKENDPQKAIQYFLDSIGMNLTLGYVDPSNLGNLSVAYSLIGEPEKAIRCCELAWHVLEEDRRFAESTTIIHELAVLNLQIDNYPKAACYAFLATRLKKVLHFSSDAINKSKAILLPLCYFLALQTETDIDISDADVLEVLEE